MKMSTLTVALALTLAGTACTQRVDFEKVPIGSHIDITRQDGGVVRGTLATRDEQAVSLTVGSQSRSFPRDRLVHVRMVNDSSIALPASAKFREFTLPEGTRLAVRLNSPVGSDSSRAGDPIGATLDNAFIIDDTEVLPAGSAVSGRVEEAHSSGKVKGRGTLSLLFDTIAGLDQPWPIAAHVNLLAASGKNKDIATIGIPAAGGALLGALLGGGKGALIGGAIGGGAGTAVALSTRGPQVRLGRGASLALRLEQATDVRVPITKW
jgi:hypothetical protein